MAKSKDFGGYYGTDYISAPKIYESIEDEKKVWNSKKATPLTEVYNEIISDFHHSKLRKTDPKTILTLEDIVGNVKVASGKGETKWVIEREFKKDVIIPNTDVKIQNFDDIKEKIRTAPWELML